MEESLYRIYMTDALRIIGENTSHCGGSYISKRYAEIINPPKADARTPNEVIQHMKSKIDGLSLIKGP